MNVPKDTESFLADDTHNLLNTYLLSATPEEGAKVLQEVVREAGLVARNLDDQENDSYRCRQTEKTRRAAILADSWGYVWSRVLLSLALVLGAAAGLVHVLHKAGLVGH